MKSAAVRSRSSSSSSPASASARGGSMPTSMPIANVSTRWLHENLSAPWLRVIDVRAGAGVARTSTLAADEVEQSRKAHAASKDESGILPRGSADAGGEDIEPPPPPPPRFVEVGPRGGWRAVPTQAGSTSSSAKKKSPLLHLASAFARGHVPGAIHLDVASRLFDPNGSLITAPELAMLMSELGVGDEHRIVLVDEDTPAAALVTAWALQHYGHEAMLLTGGFPRWSFERRPITTDVARYPFGSFTARISSSSA